MRHDLSDGRLSALINKSYLYHLAGAKAKISRRGQGAVKAGRGYFKRIPGLEKLGRFEQLSDCS
jgi:hypothetical protein